MNYCFSILFQAVNVGCNGAEMRWDFFNGARCQISRREEATLGESLRKATSISTLQKISSQVQSGVILYVSNLCTEDMKLWKHKSIVLSVISSNSCSLKFLSNSDFVGDYYCDDDDDDDEGTTEEDQSGCRYTHCSCDQIRSLLVWVWTWDLWKIKEYHQTWTLTRRLTFREWTLKATQDDITKRKRHEEAADWIKSTRNVKQAKDVF